eukprot:TRINITY_DN3_c0_g1_i2.p1 TRINITY_DN3_c0_g1~~TRINITY_DN3_c0_g1_i2.p1  ORF type:complete len:224 (-),score=34.94 TRINITY_DN3_c0_g1_i2:120-791(-)
MGRKSRWPAPSFNQRRTYMENRKEKHHPPSDRDQPQTAATGSDVGWFHGARPSLQMERDTTKTGGYHDVRESVLRSVAQQVRSDSNVKEFYIGIASSGEQGLADRFNNKYKDLGYHEITPVYTTSSDTFRKGMEAQLVDHFDSHSKCANAVAGGGGPVGSGDMSVYVAKKFYDAPPEREGPRGGSYYYNSAGNAVYGSASDGVYTGPRGGRFTYTASGNKHYL